MTLATSSARSIRPSGTVPARCRVNASALIPVSAYILIACIECYRRYPALIDEIELAKAPEEIGVAGHHVGNEIYLVRFWGVSNFPLVGRKFLLPSIVMKRSSITSTSAIGSPSESTILPSTIPPRTILKSI